MPLVASLRRFIKARWFGAMPTQRLIERVAAAEDQIDAAELLNALRERGAYHDGSLEAVAWPNARLDGATLSSCKMAGADLRHASFRGAYFGYSDLSGASFAGADLRGANLRGARLQNADLTACNFGDANLSRTDLRGARLQDACLAGANLWATDLRGADLQGASLIRCLVNGVSVDSVTTLPDGTPAKEPADLGRYTAANGD